MLCSSVSSLRLGCFKLAMLFLVLPTPASAQEKVTYDDQITALFRNNCFKCHNPDKTKGDLDLTTYSGVLKGGGSGKAVVPGDVAGSKLYRAIARIEEPFMPDKGPKLPDAEIELVRKWIAGGSLEKSSSQALAANKPKLNLLLNSAVQGKPDGPAILPVEWLLDPVQRTERTTAVTALAASPWSPLIAVGGQHQLLVYHSGTCDLAGVLLFPEGNPSCVQFSRDSRLLVVGGGRGAKFGFVDLYEVATGERVMRVGNEYDTVLAADLNSDQTEVALGGPGKHVKVFSTRDARMIHDLKKHTDWVTALQYSPDSVLLATGDRNGGLVVWEADSGQELYTLTGHQAAISSVSWRDDSEVLLSASEDGSIRLWEMREGKQAATWTAHKEGVLDARFTHDSRIVSCGRDNQIALWDASGNKQRNWDAGDLPVRATFSYDGSNILASSWQGKVGVWSVADGKPKGEITSNPPTLAERLGLANKEVERREDAAAKSEEAIVAAAAEAAKVRASLAAHDQSPPSFQFVAATRQAQAAHRKAAEESNKGLEKLKAVAAKSAAELAAAEAESAKMQAALDKVDKFSEPYKRLALQVEGASQKVATATARAGENAKALADKTAAFNAAAADLAARAAAAAQARDKASASLDELGKQSDAATRTIAQERAAADQDKATLAQQQALVSHAMTLLAAAESEGARITQALISTNKSSPQVVELSKQLEIVTKQIADARVAHENSQKTLGDLKTAADKSGALLDGDEAEVVKLKVLIETAQKAFQTSKDAVAQLEAARIAAAEAAEGETEALQRSAAQATSALAAAKAENADLQAKLDKTEKFSDAFREMTRRLDAANKQVSVARVPAENDRKEVSALQATVEKIAASLAAADVEAAKAIAMMARSDPSYQQYQELENQLETANQKVSDTKALATRTHRDLATARGVVAQIRVAQAHAVLYRARETLAARQQQHEQRLAAVVAAEEEIRASQAELQDAGKAADLVRAALKQAARTAAGHPESETTPTLLVEKQNAARTAGNQAQAAKNLVTTAHTRFAQLSRQIKLLNESMNSTVARLRSAKAAAADATPRLASEKARVEKLAAEYVRLKAAPDGRPDASR
jgi:WD40 repeat protein/archaellum component FlaC